MSKLLHKPLFEETVKLFEGNGDDRDKGEKWETATGGYGGKNGDGHTRYFRSPMDADEFSITAGDPTIKKMQKKSDQRAGRIDQKIRALKARLTKAESEEAQLQQQIDKLDIHTNPNGIENITKEHCKARDEVTHVKTLISNRESELAQVEAQNFPVENERVKPLTIATGV